MPKRLSKTTRSRQRKRYYLKHRKIHSDQKWEEWEINMVIDHKIPDVELSQLLNRGVMAIQIKRCVIKKSRNLHGNTSHKK